ncbi:glucosamine-6-phosphate deaminase [Aerococcaceae bacterium NML201209]|nr:glucosamine-6-phosphate deaminase [Aerococcaceae bacterium NML201209]MCW6662467.1 glucosamine-6-phosphate deaminase [Aerococcaceae bacterium NML190073]MCW6664465.1 glucosamine-6-phosphate deaminase [Aerococcaceae bacterium NML191219]MCW6665947.1 glucosamine-6-phosphate deaminase [Aerococcaceae bacterium NML190938]
MKIHVFDSQLDASKEAYAFFERALQNSAKVFGLATGGTPEQLYTLLSESTLDFSNCVSVNLDEYFGLAADHPKSYHHYMQTQLFDKKPFATSYLPDGTNQDVEGEIARYNQILADNPIDLQILGIGSNAHIGFNEPGTSFDSQTQLVDLTESTIEANKRYFERVEDVPTQAYSMGIASIMSAKEIILMAFGAKKAQAIKDTVEGPVTTDVPASILQTHPNVTLLLDKDAAALLTR